MFKLIPLTFLFLTWAAIGTHPAAAQNPANPGFYVGLSGSAIFLEDSDATISGVGVSVDYDTAYGIAGQAGYRFGNGLRAEGEVGYTNIDDADLNALGVTVGLNADLDVWLFTGNLFYDLHVNDWLSPYVGGGVGIARQELGSVTATFGGTTVTTSGDSSTDLTAFGEIGLNMHLTPNLDLVPGYRYAWIDNGCCGFDDTTAHIAKIGLRYNF